MRFEPVARLRPVTLVRPTVRAAGPFPQAAPSCTVLSQTTGPVTLRLTSGETSIEGVVEGRAALRVTSRGRTTLHRPRRHRWKGAYDAVALTLTGTHATVLTRTAGQWTGRARVDLAALDEPIDTHDPAFLAALHVDADSPFEAGAFGQLGLRDLRVVTRADGTPYTRRAGELLLTATSAGPGFFDTAHTSVWSLDLEGLDQPGALRHLSDLFFRRQGKVYGDHATHLVRSESPGEPTWLVATSTWGSFDGSSVEVVLARSDADLLEGTHVLDTEPLALPTGAPSTGVWDPHLVRDGERWLVGYVSATHLSPRFRFHPVVATGPRLDALTLHAERTDRVATEGTTLLRVGDDWRVLASDGRDNARHVQGRFPVFDLDLVEIGTVDADYLTNLPWPTLVLDGPEATEAVLVTFDGTPSGGRLLGYGTHGDVVVLRGAQSSSGA